MEPVGLITIPLHNYQNQLYIGMFAVGPHLFRVSFNTWTYGIWIPGRIPGVDSSHRSTYHEDVSHTYNDAPGTETTLSLGNGDVTITGKARTEQVMLGTDIDNFVIVGPQEFVLYQTVVPLQFYLNLGYDGFVGLGLPPPTNDSDPIWKTMMNQGLLQSNVFSVYLRDYYVCGTDGGSIIFGGVNQEHYEGDHQYFDLVDNSYQWKIPMYSVSVVGHPPQNCYNVLIDIGCKYIYGPPQIIHGINRQILGRDVPLAGPTFLTQGEAESLLEGPDVSFNFDSDVEDATLTIAPQNYVINDSAGERVYRTAFHPLAVQPGEEPYFVLGLPWLRRYHTVFDFGRGRIGFARATQI